MKQFLLVYSIPSLLVVILGLVLLDIALGRTGFKSDADTYTLNASRVRANRILLLQPGTCLVQK